MRRMSSRRPALERLEDRVVLGIDRQHGGAGRGGAPHEQGAGADQAFLVGKRDGRAALGRGERRREPCRAGDRRHDPIGRPLRGLDQRGLRRRRLRCREPASVVLELGIGGRIGDRRKARTEFAGEPRQLRPHRDCAVTRFDAILAGLPRAADRPCSSRSSRSRRAASPCAARLQADFRRGLSASSDHHRLPYQQAARRSVDALRRCRSGQRQAPQPEAVKTIHQAAMAGDELARILGAKPPLDRGFEQVAGLRDDRKHQGQNSATSARLAVRSHKRPAMPAATPPSEAADRRQPRSYSG